MSPLALTLLRVIENRRNPLPDSKGWDDFEGPRMAANGLQLVESFTFEGKRYGWGRGEFYVWCEPTHGLSEAISYWRFLSPERNQKMIAMLEKELNRGP